MFELAGKTACVTGASGGIGRHIASYLCQQGARVVGVARNEAKLQAWQSPLGQNAAYISADLSDLSSLEMIAQSVKKPFGNIDILINAAGVNLRQAADEVTKAGWQNTLDLNLTMPFFLAQALVQDMKNAQWGRIINFASLQSFRAFPAGIAYGASKGGVAQMTRAMAEAWSSYGVNANAIAPGFFETDLTKAVFADEKRAAANAAQTCIGRNGEMQDLEGPVHFLCSDASKYVTGQILMVDGGFTAK